MTQETELHFKRTSFRWRLPLPVPHKAIGFEVKHHRLENPYGDILERWRTFHLFYDDFSENDPYKPSLIKRFRRLIRGR